MFIGYYFVHLTEVIIVFFNDTATTEIYTLSLHDALPISSTSTALLRTVDDKAFALRLRRAGIACKIDRTGDRKSTRLNSSHANISYAVFCLKKNNRGNNFCQ